MEKLCYFLSQRLNIVYENFRNLTVGHAVFTTVPLNSTYDQYVTVIVKKLFIKNMMQNPLRFDNNWMTKECEMIAYI